MVDYDLIIIGSGPAGMNACLYATRSKLKTLVIEKNYPGGKLVKTNKIENWIGTKEIEGPELAMQMFKHAYSYGGVYEQGNVLDIKDLGNIKEVILENKKYTAYAIIICVGTSERKIGIPGEDKFYGRGVSYCAVCDGALNKEKVMVVIGNSNHAVKEALYLSKFASKLTFINDKPQLNVDKELLNDLENNAKIEIKNNCKILSINGTTYVESITIKEDVEYKINTSIIFPLLGSSPDSMFVSRLKITDDRNYVIVNEKQETNIAGIYSAGDCTNNNLKQIITASSSGAIAAMEAYKYISKLKKEAK